MTLPQKWSPCYKCEEQAPGCHSTCPGYFAFRMELEDTKKQIAKEDTHTAWVYNHRSKFLSNSSHKK